MPAITLVTVCLPATVATGDLTTTATAALAAHTTDRATPIAHFATSTRLRKRHLVQPHRDTAAGGRVSLLDLAAMRNRMRAGFWHRWQIWHRVVAATPIAKPYWTFQARHTNDPHKYNLAQARQDYLSQPRLAAMRTYNALPNKIMEVPTAQLEGFQAGADTYAHLGWLSAVPGNAMITPRGVCLKPASDKLADAVTFFEQANACLAAMGRHDQLIALATTR
jgi:hypothetical protein